MTDIILVGAGGCMRELAWQIEESNKDNPKWNIVGYINKASSSDKEEIIVGDKIIPYLGDDKYILSQRINTNVVLSVGNVELRSKLYELYKVNEYIKFPNIIIAGKKICKDVQLGQGCIISDNVKISTNVKLGDFVFVNMDSTICHDGRIEDFVSINPRVTLAGNVHVGKSTEIGMGTNIIQGIGIGKNVVIGAGSVVIRDVEDNSRIAGVPAKNIRH